MQVVTLCGSHHSGSTNAVLLESMTSRLEAHGATVTAIDVSDDLPAFRPELVDRPPEGVAALQQSFRAADAAVFAVPEYAGGMPGWVKNLLDWMVGAAALYERPVAVTSAATGGGANAIEQLARTLTWQGAYVVATCGVAAPLTMVRDAEITDDEVVEQLHGVADRLVEVVRGERAADEAAAAALAPLGMVLADRLV